MRAILCGLALSLALAAPVGAADPLFLCGQDSAEDALFRFRSCALEVEGGQTVTVVFPSPEPYGVEGIHSDYGAYPAAAAIKCIRSQVIYLRAAALRLKVTNMCPADAYLVVELTVPR